MLAVALAGLGRPQADRALLRLAIAELERLHTHMHALEVIGTLSPRLRLLGTVLGMIEPFDNWRRPVSGGTWQALLITAVGLAIAIATVLAHGWLERRAERCGHQMEDAVTRAFTRDLGVAGSASVPAADSELVPEHAL